MGDKEGAVLAAPPLALYIHLPWCVEKCPYCDFNSYALAGEPDERAYVNALLADLDQEIPLVRGRELSSIFIGGGTPSLFSGDAVGRLLEGVWERIGWQPEAEITLEANPGAGDSRRYRGYFQAGVNRLSIGVQSFQAERLAALGRIHGPQEAVAAVETAKAAGFVNINVDLMFGLPGQSPDEARRDVETAVALNPSHISYYQLTLEPNTRFFSSPPVLPNDDQMGEIEVAGHHALAESGYRQYEVSAFARPGWECRHNLNYWTFGDYIGIGAGAHGKLTDEAGAVVERRWRLKSPEAYLAAAGTPAVIAGTRILGEQDLIAEFMMNVLRLKEGFLPELFEQRTGLSPASLEKPLAEARAKGLLEISAQGIRPTRTGFRFLNELLTLFLPETRDE